MKTDEVIVINVNEYSCKNISISKSMNVCMFVFSFGWMCICMYVCMLMPSSSIHSLNASIS